MLTWNPQLYRRYEEERTRPAAELLARVPLATARQVAVRHGGAVKVKRNESSGITTSIVLPGNC